MKKIEIFQDNWTTEDVSNDKNKIFVFGDNDIRIGRGGQAVIRDLPNARGIRTKKGPSNKPVAFYTDKEFSKNVEKIREDILNVKKELISGKKVVLSANGYGTGLAQLEKTAPKTFQSLNNLLLGHFNFDNTNGTLSTRIPGYMEITSAKYVSIDNKKFESNVLSPINNSYFKSEYLSKNINTLYDLVKSGKKLAFTYPISHSVGDIVLLTFANSQNYLVCRICDSYDWKSIDSSLWSLFEGFDESYIQSLNLINKDQKLYQNHIEFICTLDDNGKMEYRDDLFVKEEIVLPDNIKKVGETIVEEVEEKSSFTFFKKKNLNQLLKENNLLGEITEMPKIGKQSKYQVKVGDLYYAVEFKKGILWNSINIILTSKNPFI